MFNPTDEEPPIHPEEIRSTMWAISDIRVEVMRIRRLLEEDDGEEETENDDA